MKKDVIIQIHGNQRVDGKDNPMELITQGTFYEKNGNYYIIYDETDATGFDGSKTTLKVEGQRRVTMTRSGSTRSHLIIEKQLRHLCQYGTPCGEILIGVFANHIENELNDSGGKLSFRYSLDINAAAASENKVDILVKERKATL